MPEDSEESVFVRAAEVQIDRLVRANRTQRIIIAVVVILIILLALVAWNQHRQAIQSCNTGNIYRQQDSQIWNYFINIAAQGDTKSSDQVKIREIEAFVAKLDAPRSCVGTWNLLSDSSYT